MMRQFDLLEFINIATSEYYDAQECATKIVPAISLVLIDKEKYVLVGIASHILALIFL